jgi:hypothetical protein
MKKIIFYIAVIFFASVDLNAQQADSLFVYNDSLHLKKHPWRAAIEALGVNVSVWAYNRYLDNKYDFSDVNLHSIRENIKTGFIWDNNLFSSNQLLHPYHGSFYFSAARSSGLNFWQSMPYSFAGSFTWEICGETTPPSINDLLTTTFAGTALGEVTFRLSSLILDDSKHGANRFFREFVGTVISPVRGLNRLITGDAWKVKHQYYKYHDYDKLPVKFTLSLGNRYFTDNASMFKGHNNVYSEFKMIYGDPLHMTTNVPYDYFRFSTVINWGGPQPLISSVNVNAKLFGKYLQPLPGHKAFVGMFQHFDYFDSKIVVDGSKSTPFKMAEAAAVGLGVLYVFPVNKNVIIRHSSYYNAVLLGASLTDYYRLGRDYNLGSGLSIKSYTNIDFGKYGNFELYIHDYHLYTWRGYKDEDLSNKTKSPYFYLNTQGDKSDAQLIIINPIIGKEIFSRMYANLGLYYYFRKTNYLYKPDVFSRTFELRFGLRYAF